MHTTNRTQTAWPDLAAPERNRYFYGMLMDVFHFERETAYFNRMRRLINRLVLGYGVICGLDVREGPEPNQVIVTPGVALDSLGNEIIVPAETQPYTIPAPLIAEAVGMEVLPIYRPQQGKPDQTGCVQVLLCYQECQTDPAPSLAGDCGSADPCLPSTTREQYRIFFREGCVDRPEHDCQIPDLVDNGHLNYEALVRWVTNECPTLPDDGGTSSPCIPLANVLIEREDDDHCHQRLIDINVRPIVYGLDLLYEILLGVIEERPRGRYNK